ncbi:MAG TPA: hypothetical protein VFS21_12550 [Roseiflexaceae bacterium]|nr:hypothetical protein [Roseiflexaceae bacterium]
MTLAAESAKQRARGASGPAAQGLRALRVGWAGERGLALALLAALLLWSLAYQAPYSYQIDVGGSVALQRRWDDRPFLRDLNEPEPADPRPADCAPPQTGPDGFCDWWDLGREPYRWTGEDSVVALPGLGGGGWAVQIRASGQPLDQAPPTLLEAGGAPYPLELARGPRLYQLQAQADGLSGDLTLRFVTPPFTPPGDPRALGFPLHRVTVSSTPGPRVPPPVQLALLLGALAGVYGLARNAGASRRATLAGAAGLILTVAALLAFARAGLTVFTPTLALVVGGLYALQLALLALPTLGRRPAVVGLVLLALLLRLGGLLHPNTRDSDIGLNANNLLSFSVYETVYTTEGLPDRAGGGESPYPPGQYVLLAPLQLLLPVDMDGRRLILQIGNALLDSLVVAGIWYVMRRAGLGRRAALLGAALYVASPPPLRSLSVGELANVSGQALAFPALALLAFAPRPLGSRRGRLAVAALLAVALLGHSGVSISLALLLGCLWLAYLLARRQSLAPLTLTLAGGVALAGLLYYSAFLHLLAARPTPAAGLDLAAVGQNLLNEWRRNFDGLPGQINLVLLLGGGSGLLLTLRRRAGRRAGPLVLLLLACWGGALLSLGALLATAQTVRWLMFLLPALCIGGGIALAALSQRGRAGRVGAGLLLAALLVSGTAFWIERVTNYLH